MASFFYKESLYEEGSRLKRSFLPGLLFIGLMWLVFVPAWFQGLELGQYGLYPRRTFGLLGVLTAPFLHADWAHLLSNTFPLLLLSAILFHTFPVNSGKISGWLFVLTGLLSWVMARPAYHIGASGVVYALAGFMFFSGLFRRDRSAASIALAIAFLYGGMIYGIFPSETKEHISWESHLAGGIVGMLMAFIFRKTELPPPAVIHPEPEEEITRPPHLNVTFTGQPEIIIRYTYVPKKPEPPEFPETFDETNQNH